MRLIRHMPAFWAALPFLLLLEECAEPKAQPDSWHPRLKVACEWRESRRIVATENIHLPGPFPPNAFLRLGVRAERNAGPIQVTVDVGGDVNTLSVTDFGQWTDLRLSLPQTAGQTPSCEVTLTCNGEFQLSHCNVLVSDPDAPTVLIVLIDALRQDHMSCYGYPLKTTPRAEAFAADAVVFTQLMPQSSWTRPSVATLMTGVYPGAHGVHDRQDAIRDGMPSLAKHFRQAGYETQAFINNPNCLPKWGFGEGFTRYVDINSEQWQTTNDADVADTAIHALRDTNGLPRFFYIHLMAPHDPQNPPQSYHQAFMQSPQEDSDAARQQATIVGLYDAEVAYADEQFGRLLDVLREQGTYDAATIVLISDHGEELLDHGQLGHGKTVFEEVLRVPFLLKTPGARWRGTTHDELVEMLDIAPTLLDIHGLPPDSQFQGESLLSLMRGESWTKSIGFASTYLADWSAVTAKTTRLKYIHNVAAGWRGWYNLYLDPTEMARLETPPPEAHGLRAHAERTAAQGTAGLHVLLTQPSDACTILVRFAGPNLLPAELRYDQQTVKPTAATADSCQYEFQMKPDTRIPDLQGSFPREEMHGPAHLIIPLEPDATLELTVRKNADIVDPTCVQVGPDHRPETLDAYPIDPEQLTAMTHQYEPSLLPEEFGVYIWHVPEAEAFEDSELTEEMKEALRGLGYLN